jgi:RNA polymerase sigma-70 factor, ECF subfamily
VKGVPRESGADGEERSEEERILEGLFLEHRPGMCAFVRQYVRSAAVAEELVQDVFLAVWLRPERARFSGNPRTYLYRAARNRALNHLERERREQVWHDHQSTMDPPTSESAGELLTQNALMDALETSIDRLPPGCRQVFLLSRAGGLTYAEIAATLELSIKTVEAQMGRALRLLRPMLAPILVPD